jgi:hypothetical protein
MRIIKIQLFTNDKRHLHVKYNFIFSIFKIMQFIIFNDIIVNSKIPYFELAMKLICINT